MCAPLNSLCVACWTVVALPLVGTVIGQEAGADKIVVENAKAGPLYESNWTGLPDYLKGASVYLPTQGNTLDFTARDNVQVVIAASWAHDGDPSPEWYPGRTMLSELIADGWQPIGKATRQGRGQHHLLRKSLKAGEQVKFHTRKKHPPFAFIVAPGKAEALAAVPAAQHTSAQISEVEPPPQREASKSGHGVALRAHEPIVDYGFFERGILFRELVRQAVLLAAREELGQATRDDTLRERSADGKAAEQQPLDIVVEVNRDGRVNVTLFRFVDRQPETLWDKYFVLDGENILLALIADAERLSREELPAALKKAEFNGKANRHLDDARFDEGLKPLLTKMHPLFQFDAARQLHALIRSSGESPERLAHLARAYANLGLLTEHLWFPGHKVFKARALLYAERGVKRWPDSRASLAGRAYARALVGLHSAALDDIERLRAMPADNDERIQSERRLLEAVCRFEMDKLNEDIANGRNRELAQVLRLAAVERYSGTAVTLEAANDVLESVADSDRAIDAIYETRRLGTRGEAAQLGLERSADWLYRRMQSLESLPKEVEQHVLGANARQSADERKDRLALIRSLRRAGELGQDRDEPSWQSVATWVEEVAFLQSSRQLEFLATGLSVPLDDARKELEGLLADHPYREFFASMCDDMNQRREKLTELAKVPEHDTQLNETFIWTRLTYNGFQQGRTLYNLAYHHQDWIYRDLLATTRVAYPDMRPHFAALLRQASPHSPPAASTSIEHDWDYAANQAVEWETRFIGSPQVQAALGKQYSKQENYEDAVRCLKRAVDALPEHETYKVLAEAWLKLGNEKEWQATWDDFLKQPDFGLEQARARVAVAEHFMLGGKFDKALPYAEEAAETFAEWAMLCAADCLTGLGRWAEAEQYLQLVAERYPGSAMNWYLWCQRTGKGKLAEARKHLQSVIDNPRQGVHPASRAAFLTMEGEKRKALEVYQGGIARHADWLMAWRAAVLADELREEKVRDDMIRTVLRVSTSDRPDPSRVEFARLVQQALAKPEKMAQFADDARAFIDRLEVPREKASYAHFAGKLLVHRDRAEGQALIQQAADLPFIGLTTAAATVDMRQRAAAR
jgi:tetratricopeptide (TPR) repeat protein